MYVNEVHPAEEPLSKGSAYTGSTSEMHDEPHRLAHVHIQLIGEQRDEGLETLGLMKMIKDELKVKGWD